MPKVPVAQSVRCPICKVLLIENKSIIAPHHEFAFGIHPDEMRQWEMPPPIVKTDYRLCLSHPALPKLMSRMNAALPYRLAGLNMPDYIDWLGHWITVTRFAPDFCLLFNVQMPKRQFLDILCALPEEFGELAHKAKNYAAIQ